MITCLECGILLKNNLSLGHHVKKHNMSSKDYYDKFMKKGNEEICSNPLCNNETSFFSFKEGYHKHCCERCSTLNPETQTKMKSTSLELHGVEYALQSKEIFNKMKEKNKKKFGFENVRQVDHIKEKTKKTCMNRYGGNSPSSDKEVIKKKKNTNLNMYGDSNFNNRNKSKKTCISKYGVSNVSKVEKIKNKKKETSFKRIGVTHHFKTEEHIEYMKNGGAAYLNTFIRNPSKPQIRLFELCQECLPYPIMNYPCLNKSIDIVIPSLSIAIEYDGSYWHKDSEADKKRQKLLEEEGWKFIRYMDRIPNKNELINDCKNILRT